MQRKQMSQSLNAGLLRTAVRPPKRNRPRLPCHTARTHRRPNHRVRGDNGETNHLRAGLEKQWGVPRLCGGFLRGQIGENEKIIGQRDDKDKTALRKSGWTFETIENEVGTNFKRKTGWLCLSELKRGP